MKILHAYGQTCNKFFTYINYIADGIETGEKIVILSPDITTRYYSNLRKSGVVKFPFYRQSLINTIGYNRYVHWLSSFWGNRYSVKIAYLFFKLVPSVDFVTAPTGSYRSPHRLKHDLALKKFFTPDHIITSEVESVFGKIKKNHDIICGVHFRFGDYRSWQGGRYYYSKQQYYAAMLNFKKLFPDQSVAFFVSSNENIDLTLFPDCTCFSLPNSNSVKDLYGLSQSDYIIGPPSTFSAWAAYHGSKYLYFIEDPAVEITLSNFKKGLDIWK